MLLSEVFSIMVGRRDETSSASEGLCVADTVEDWVHPPWSMFCVAVSDMAEADEIGASAFFIAQPSKKITVKKQRP